MDTKPSVWEQEGKKKARAWHHSLPYSAQALSGMGQPESLIANKPWKVLFSNPPTSALHQSPLLFSVQSSSVAQSCPTLCDPMNCSMPGLPVHHHLPEFTQTHVHRVGDDIQLFYPLPSPFPPALSPSQHQSLFQ